MTDTVKIPRPRFARSKTGPKGRVEHDSLGNAVWVRTRAEDAVEGDTVPALSIEETQKGDQSYPEFAGAAARAGKKRRAP